MEGDKGMKERKGRWVNNEQTEGGGGGGGFSRRSEIILTESRGRRFNVRPASRTTGNASGGRSRSPPVGEVAQPRISQAL